MSHKTPPSAGEMLHLRGQRLSKGDPIALPLVQASMYHLPGEPDGASAYGRGDNATWIAAEHLLGHLEASPCLLFPSGMAAISAALFATLKAGDSVLLPADGYFATRVLASRFLSRLGVNVEQRATSQFSEGGFDGFAAVFVETPSNPGLDVVDLAFVTRKVREAGGKTIVDNTTMTPFGQRPLELGADIVVASDTKAPSGHSDLLLGHVACRDGAVMELVEAWRKFSGAIPGPMQAWLLHRSLETLELRFERMCNSAELVAERLVAHRSVKGVRYPGLSGDPSHELARAQMIRFGFLMEVTLESAEAAEAFIDGCTMLRPATSFGGVHSSAERRARWGDTVSEGAVRLSVGCEPVEDLWAALEASLSRL